MLALEVVQLVIVPERRLHAYDVVGCLCERASVWARASHSKRASRGTRDASCYTFPRAVVVEGRYKSADYKIFALAAAGRENLDLTASGGRENLNHAAAEARKSDLAGSKCQIFASRRSRRR
jgi:hypothetical protein